MTNNLKKYVPLITYGILLYFIVHNISTVIGYIGSAFQVLMPLFIGLILAFVINMFLRFYEKKVYDKIFKKNPEKYKKAKRPVCIILSYLSFAAIIYAIIAFLAPRISDSISTLTRNIPSYINSISQFLYNLALEYEFTEDIWNKLIENFGVIITNTSQFLNTTLPKIVDITKDVTSSVVDIFIGFVFSAYILFSKEKLINILNKVLHAHIPEKTADKIQEIIATSNKTFRSFVGGQLTEALILAVLCYIGMTIFKMPYAPLVSVIIGISSIIPVIGPFIGTIPCTFLILLESPVMALWFILFVIVLQQFEGNIIYPKVVGSAIGLSGFWVLLAVTVGGGLFGVMGILLGVPIMAVIYTLYGTYVNNKLKLNEAKDKGAK